MINQAFGQVVKELRGKRKLSQEALSFEADLHRTYISQLERGIKSPSLNTMQKLSKVLGVSLTELMNLVEEKNNVIPAHGK
ncbi:MAG: hypothetical protein BWK80_28115 [Desulfobacteraceae bacterium IS3]|nr:MAG: hypothetical protein BWK80_28115 [Desulfobacteraceae bacterium IS3]